jgi:hypothetical protein
MDSTFFALHAELPPHHAKLLRYFEVDFKEVISRAFASIVTVLIVTITTTTTTTTDTTCTITIIINF